MILYLIAAFFVGYSSLIYQVVFLREFLTIFYGNELCVGTIIGIWLAGIALGALIGSRVSDRIKQRRDSVFLIIFAGMHILFPLMLFLLRVSSPVFLIGARGQYLSFARLLLALCTFVVPVSMTSGILFPMACGFTYRKGRGGVTSGMVYFAESMGSLVGGCLFTFVFILYLNYFQIAFMQLGLALLLCVIFMMRTSKKSALAAFVATVILNAVLYWQFVPSTMDRYTTQKRWDAFFDPLPLDRSVDTKYQNVAVSSRDSQIDLYTNLKYRCSIPDPYTNELFAQYVMCQSPHPDDILIIQELFSGLIDPCRSHRPQSITILELDKQYYDTVAQSAPALVDDEIAHPNVHLAFVDGRFFIKQTDTRYDVIIINVPDPESAMLNRFYTREFFYEIKSALKTDGVLALKLTSAPNFMGDAVGKYNSSIYKTLVDVFDDVIVTHGETKFFVACDSASAITSNADDLIQRYIDRGIERERFIPQAFLDLLNPARLAFVKQNLDDRACSSPINTNINPVAYHFNLYMWDQFSGSRLTGLLKKIEQLSVRHIVLALALITGILLAAVYASKSIRQKNIALRSVLLWVICSTGFTAMGMEMLLLFAFQNIFGYLYSMIGFIVALFMFGLTVGVMGGMYGVSRLKKSQKIVLLLLTVEVILPLCAFFLPSAIDFAGACSAPWQTMLAFFVMVAGCGILTGIEFPLAVHLFALKPIARRFFERYARRLRSYGSMYRGIVYRYIFTATVRIVSDSDADRVVQRIVVYCCRWQLQKNSFMNHWFM